MSPVSVITVAIIALAEAGYQFNTPHASFVLPDNKLTNFHTEHVSRNIASIKSGNTNSGYSQPSSLFGANVKSDANFLRPVVGTNLNNDYVERPTATHLNSVYVNPFVVCDNLNSGMLPTRANFHSGSYAQNLALPGSVGSNLGDTKTLAANSNLLQNNAGSNLGYPKSSIPLVSANLNNGNAQNFMQSITPSLGQDFSVYTQSAAGNLNTAYSQPLVAPGKASLNNGYAQKWIPFTANTPSITSSLSNSYAQKWIPSTAENLNSDYLQSLSSTGTSGLSQGYSQPLISSAAGNLNSGHSQSLSSSGTSGLSQGYSQPLISSGAGNLNSGHSQSLSSSGTSGWSQRYSQPLIPSATGNLNYGHSQSLLSSGTSGLSQGYSQPLIPSATGNLNYGHSQSLLSSGTSGLSQDYSQQLIPSAAGNLNSGNSQSLISPATGTFNSVYSQISSPHVTTNSNTGYSQPFSSPVSVASTSNAQISTSASNGDLNVGQNFIPQLSSSSFSDTANNDQTPGSNTGVIGPVDIPSTVYKHVYFHVPPLEDDQKVVRPAPQQKKNYKILFIKVPSQEINLQQIAQIRNNAAAAVEHKTLIYVLVKKPEAEQPVVIPKQTPSEHEVFFVKYNGNPLDLAGQVHAELDKSRLVQSLLKPGLVNGQNKSDTVKI